MGGIIFACGSVNWRTSGFSLLIRCTLINTKYWHAIKAVSQCLDMHINLDFFGASTWHWSSHLQYKQRCLIGRALLAKRTLHTSGKDRQALSHTLNFSSHQAFHLSSPITHKHSPCTHIVFTPTLLYSWSLQQSHSLLLLVSLFPFCPPFFQFCRFMFLTPEGLKRWDAIFCYVNDVTVQSWCKLTTTVNNDIVIDTVMLIDS